MRFLIRSLDIMSRCVHMLYSTRMLSCLNTCLRENMCLNCLSSLLCGHACIHVNAPVCITEYIACLSPLESLWVFVWARESVCRPVHVHTCVHMCSWVYVNSVWGLQGSTSYLALAAGGAQQVPNCCRPHNGFYTPGAGKGPWLSCRLGSPPLYPCRLHWRSSQSVKRKQIKVQL